MKVEESRVMTMFTVANQNFGWPEIVLAAQVWGEWQPFIETVRQSLACLRLATRNDELPKAAELRQAANAFRYAHNLISAEETNHWLHRWEVSIDDWMNYLRGQLLRGRWAQQIGEVVAAYPVSEQEVAEVTKGYAVCADKLRDWAVRLAGRAALAADSGGFAVGERPAIGSADDLIAAIEAEFARQQKEAVTAKLIDSKIAHHRLDWMRFDCRYLWFAEERVAREAAWCISEDGLSLDEVANRARATVQAANFYADEIELQVRPYFLAARQGDLLGPLKIWQGFPLISLLRKQLPAADDPLTRARAEQAILASLTEQAMNQRVRWSAQ
jgi:hypothetical protein